MSLTLKGATVTKSNVSDQYLRESMELDRIQATHRVIVDATTFCHSLVDFVGYADFDSCHVMAWLCDQHRPLDDGAPRFQGRLYLDIARLSRLWNLPEETIDDCMHRIQRSGLATFHNSKDGRWVEVHWDAVEDAARLSRESQPLDA